jgi:PIN domain nuclease of toxin-antitoxin system
LDGSLSSDASTLVQERAETVFASAASIWEIEIKRAQGRLRASIDLSDLVDRSGFERLPITFEHAVEAGRLPLVHRDPFDRMLVAQARVEGMTLASADEEIQRYGVATVAIARG